MSDGEKNSSAAAAAPIDQGQVVPAASCIEACTRCGLSFRRAMLFALFQDGGGQTSVDPLQCPLPSGKLADHDFQYRSAA